MSPAFAWTARPWHAAVVALCCLTTADSLAEDLVTDAQSATESASIGAAPQADPQVRLAQVSNPADEQRSQQASATGEAESADRSHVGTWEMEAVTVEGHRSELREEDRIGPYAQPRWTAHRRFPSTRVYVRPPGEVDLEQWYRLKVPREGDNELVTQTELEFGLPHRFQLDLYLITRREGDTETFVDNAVELRYAFADWGKVWGNPTIYLEWVDQDSTSDKYEIKLLLGDELSPGWHWGSNFVWEQTMRDSEDTELEWTFGLSRTLSDEKFSLGLETKFAWANVKYDRDNWEEDLRIGPSIQWRPLPQMHIDFAPLFGITSSSKRADVFAIVGWEF
jgi:hypothetical protein